MFEKYKAQFAKKQPVIFNESGKIVGFISWKKERYEGYDCPIESEPESIKQKLKRISKPKIIEVEK